MNNSFFENKSPFNVSVLKGQFQQFDINVTKLNFDDTQAKRFTVLFNLFKIEFFFFHFCLNISAKKGEKEHTNTPWLHYK